MAWNSSVIAFLALLLVLQPRIALSDLLSPLLSPVFDNICKEVECGKGTCKGSSNGTFGFECECETGWKQTRSDDDDHLKFLPCVVPNCTLDTSCTSAPSPVQEKERRANASIFDACYWANCGGGLCNKTSGFTYSCDCTEGYYNLLNVTAFPCFKQCAIGLDCKNLGITLSNKTTAVTPALADDATSILQGNSHWLIILMMSMAMVLWK
ncbi:uncharacterized protein LOC132178912 isoform X2 [Corylus avellana]|uniref:uncharacterized protein LOC132178912 isoform X2 n=1 Tax=Corylus avellana TaxID=13451 RepID=UPI00286A5E97|nr:uncharacterized protein LOC132178912 isoform X2 [Corylus avellana]